MRIDRSWWSAVGTVALAVACAGSRESETLRASEGRIESAPVLGQRFERNFPWGQGQDQFRRTPSVPESVVQGPNAVAVTSDGRPLVLDRLAGRVVSLDAVSPLRGVATVSVDSEDLAAGTDGTWLAFSPLRARVSVFDADGKSLGELPVPRELRDGVGFDIGISRRVRLRTGYQEVIELGSPSAPLPLPVALRTKREGAYQLADGRGVAVRATDAGASLVLVSQPADEAARSEIEKEIPLPGAPTAARVVGGQGNVVCLKSESVSSAPALSVSRRASCVDVATGTVVFDEMLPAPGLYVPRTEVAFGAGRLAFIHPTEKGLTVTSVAVLGKEVAP
ncbi:MAG: hypothetical protein IPM35_34720 [Myxococcales bacterium]|nr:hypothetical protein [Myxococcales bacterium]